MTKKKRKSTRKVGDTKKIEVQLEDPKQKELAEQKMREISAGIQNNMKNFIRSTCIELLLELGLLKIEEKEEEK